MQNNKKYALIIGGTGIIGNPLVMKLITHNEYVVHSISLSKASDPIFPPSVQQHVMDRTSDTYPKFINHLNSQITYWDIVVDLIAFDEKSAEQTYSLFKDHSKQIITLSTTLTYDRSHKSTEPISETTPLAKEGDFGGYVDGKVRLEKFWQNISDINWTILRPYHVLGRHSLLGCLPEHNRDSFLIQKLKNGEALKLCNAGNIAFNYIHPKDIAGAIYIVAGNQKTFKQIYNLANPDVIYAKDYYSEIARQIGTPVTIQNVPMAEIWRDMKGWEMTTLPHVYDTDKLYKDTGYKASIPLTEAISDAISTYKTPSEAPIQNIPIHQRMNKAPQPKPIKWLFD